MKLIKDEYKSRKIILIVGTIVTIFVGVWQGKISDTIGIPSIVTLVLGYCGINYKEKTL
jgi:hypothetical protein